MTEAIVIALSALLAAAVTGLIGYLVARRTTSGTVATSAAVELWTANTSLRDYLTAQVVGLRAQLITSLAQATAASTRISELLAKVDAEQAAADFAREETRKSRQETAELKAAIDAVHVEVKTGNNATLGALADRAESRRISEIPAADRTPAENDHVDTLGIPDGSPGATHP